MSNKPQIRFNRYSSDWEQRKLGSIFEEYSEKGHPELPALTIIQGGGTISRDESDRALHYSKTNLANYKMVNAGDFIVHLRSFEGGLEKATTQGIISPAYHTFHGEGIDPRFYYSYFRSPTFVGQDLRPHVYGIRDGRSIDIKGLKTISIPWTTLEEQTAIGDYIDCLDSLIILNEQKHSKYQEIKACFLQELFCNSNSSDPRIRFSEYSEKWQKTGLGKVITPYTDYLPTPTNGYTRLGIRSHMKGTFYEFVAPSRQLGEKRLQRVKRDNFIVNIVFAWEHAIAVTTEEDEGKLVSHRFPQFSFNEGMYPRFFHYALNDERFRHHLWLASPSGAGRNKTLRIDEMMEYELRVPKYDEQKKIADFLTSLDELIEFYNYRITKLQNIKAACLQGMFI